MGFTSDACWFLLLKSLLTKINKKGEAALKNEAGGDKKHLLCLYTQKRAIYVFTITAEILALSLANLHCQ